MHAVHVGCLQKYSENEQCDIIEQHVILCKHIYFFIFLILPVGSILLIAYILITSYCEAPQTIMDLALKEKNIIIIL